MYRGSKVAHEAGAAQLTLRENEVRADTRALSRLQQGSQDGSAACARVHDGVVTGGVQSVVEEVRRAVREQRVALHLPEADAAAELAPLDGLVSQRVDRTG